MFLFILCPKVQEHIFIISAWNFMLFFNILAFCVTDYIYDM